MQEYYTNRIFRRQCIATIFKIVDLLLTVIPLAVITWVLLKLFRKTFAKYSLSNIFLATSFVIIWGISIFRLTDKLSGDVAEIDASWFGTLNSLFIITLAPLFSNGGKVNTTPMQI
ncbi:MAG: hypothetical protein HC798_03665 [Polaribacter sp.]|nr:hypothetical protein [Polaribacter sp.]